MQNNVLDDRGTTPEAASELLQKLLSDNFDDEIDLLAEALGRPTSEIEGFINGHQQIDEDLLMKMRGLEHERELKLK